MRTRGVIAFTSVVACVLLHAFGAPGAAAAAQSSGGAAGEARVAESRVLVMPFENVTRDPRIFWLGEGAAVLLTDDLIGLGPNAITRYERRQAFDRLQVPPAAVLTDATVIRIGQIVGATVVVIGSLSLEHDTLIVRARAIALEAGRVVTDATERGPVADVFATVERVARRIAPPSDRSSEEIQRDHQPVAAFESYIKGLLAETPVTAITYLRAALAIRPSFERARIALWDIYAQQGDHQRALEAVAPIIGDSALARRAQFLTGLSQLALKKYDEAFATFKTLGGETPSATVLNNLGIIQLRRGGTPQAGQPAYYFNKAAGADSSDPDYSFNLGYCYWQARDAQAASYWLREAVRRNPADGDAHFVLGAALSMLGNGLEASREKELARRLSSAYEEWEKRPANDVVPKGLERVKNDIELPHGLRVEETLAATERQDQAELARFYLGRGRRLFEQENDRDAIVELNRAIYLSPYQAEAHLMVGRIHLRNGRVREAIDALKISIWSAETVAALVALGEAHAQAKDLDAARADAERALSLEPANADAKRLLEKIGPKPPDALLYR